MSGGGVGQQVSSRSKLTHATWRDEIPGDETPGDETPGETAETLRGEYAEQIQNYAYSIPM